jgi:hypothetical protein
MDEGQLGIGEELHAELIDCTIVKIHRGVLENVLRHLDRDSLTNDQTEARLAQQVRDILNG